MQDIMSQTNLHDVMEYTHKHSHTVIHFHFGSVQFSVKGNFAGSVRRKIWHHERDPDNFEHAAASVSPEPKFR